MGQIHRGHNTTPAPPPAEVHSVMSMSAHGLATVIVVSGAAIRLGSRTQVNQRKDFLSVPLTVQTVQKIN